MGFLIRGKQWNNFKGGPLAFLQSTKCLEILPLLNLLPVQQVIFLSSLKTLKTYILQEIFLVELKKSPVIQGGLHNLSPVNVDIV